MAWNGSYASSSVLLYGVFSILILWTCLPVNAVAIADTAAAAAAAAAADIVMAEATSHDSNVDDNSNKIHAVPTSSVPPIYTTSADTLATPDSSDNPTDDNVVSSDRSSDDSRTTATSDDGEDIVVSIHPNPLSRNDAIINTEDTSSFSEENSPHANGYSVGDGGGIVITSSSLPLSDDEEVPDILTFDMFRESVLATEDHKANAAASASANRQVEFSNNNYASRDCGARVVDANKGMKETNAVLLENRDAYMLSPCKEDKWFVVELCEEILVHHVELANFEFFSSMFRNFRIYGAAPSVADQPPTWVLLGDFEADIVRTVQRFDIPEPGVVWAKQIEVHLLDHTGEEFYCPVSLMRVYGINVVEHLKGSITDHKDAAPDEGDDMQNIEVTSTKDGEARSNESGSLLHSMWNTAAGIVELLDSRIRSSSDVFYDDMGDDAVAVAAAAASAAATASPSESTTLNEPEQERTAKKTPLVTLYVDDDDDTICGEEEFVTNGTTINETIDFYIDESLPTSAPVDNLKESTADVHDEKSDNVEVESSIPSAVEASGDAPGQTPTGNVPKISQDNVNVDFVPETIASVPSDTSWTYSNDASTCIDVPVESTSIDKAASPLNAPTPTTVDPTTQVDDDPSINDDPIHTLVAETTVFDSSDVTGDTNGHDSSTESSNDADSDSVSPVLQQQHIPPSLPDLPAGTQESVFMKMSKKLRLLEQNISLTTRYLDRLGATYGDLFSDVRALEKRVNGIIDNSDLSTASLEGLRETIALLSAELNEVEMVGNRVLDFTTIIITVFVSVFFSTIASVIIVQSGIFVARPVAQTAVEPTSNAAPFSGTSLKKVNSGDIALSSAKVVNNPSSVSFSTTSKPKGGKHRRHGSSIMKPSTSSVENVKNIPIRSYRSEQKVIAFTQVPSTPESRSSERSASFPCDPDNIDSIMSTSDRLKLNISPDWLTARQRTNHWPSLKHQNKNLLQGRNSNATKSSESISSSNCSSKATLKRSKSMNSFHVLQNSVY